MRRFTSLFGHPRRNSAKKSSIARRNQLGMENLESRELMTVDIAHNFQAETPVTATTASLQSPPVYLIFKGSYFNTPAGQAAESQIISATQNFVSGPFLTGLTEYGSDGKATYGASFTDITNFGVNFTRSNVNTEIYNSILNKNSAIPRPNTPAHAPLYLVITDPNQISGAAGAGGYNFQGGFKYNNNTYVTQNIWIATNFNNAAKPTQGINIDNYTVTLSHEMAEAITDPDYKGAEFIRPADLPAAITPGVNQDQISDFETDGGTYQYRVNGTEVQSFWSENNQVFEFPDGNQQTVLLTPNWSGGGTFKGNYTLSFTDPGVATITTDNGGGLNLKLGAETFQFAPGVITGVDAKGVAGSSLVVYDGANTTAGANYRIYTSGTQDALSMPNGTQIKAESSLGAMHLFTSNYVASQVTVDGNDKYTGLTVNMGGGGGNISTNFHEQVVNNFRVINTAMAGNLSIYATSNTTLDVYDNAIASITYTVGNETIKEASGPTIDFHGMSLARLHSNGGTVDYEFTAGGSVPINVVGSTGNTTVHLTSAFLGGSTTPAPVSFIGGGGYDTLWVDDGSYATPLSKANLFNVYEMSDHSVSVRYFTVGFDGSVDRVRLGTSDRISSIVAVYGLTNLTTAELDIGRAATSVTTEFVSYDQKEALFNNITIYGSPASTLEAADYSTSGGDYTLTNNTITDQYYGTVNYSGFGAVVLGGSSGTNTFNIVSTSATATTTVDGGGNDTFNVGDANGTLNGIAGPLTMHGAGPLATSTNSTLTLNDTATQPGYFTLNGNQYTRAGIGTIAWDGMANLTVNSAPLPAAPAAGGAGQGIGGMVNNPITNPGDPAAPGISQILNNPVFINPVSSNPVSGVTPISSIPVSSLPSSLGGLSGLRSVSSLRNVAALHDVALTQM